MTSNPQVVRDLIHGWEARDLGLVMSYFHPEACYHNIPMEPLEGTEAISAFIGAFLRATTAIEWEVHHIAEAENGVVLTERTDRFLREGRWLSVRVMGTFEVVDGKVLKWRDYYDSEQMRS